MTWQAIPYPGYNIGDGYQGNSIQAFVAPDGALFDLGTNFIELAPGATAWAVATRWNANISVPIAVNWNSMGHITDVWASNADGTTGLENAAIP